MKTKEKNRLVAFAVPFGLAAGLALAGQPAAAQPWVTDPQASVVRDGFGGCWEAKGGVTDIEVPEACGGVRDSDGDGVPDDKDQCPGTPKGVEVDADGCPLDSDGDGVPDYKDKCPGTPAGAPVDADGCPLDSDGDGVPDYRDRCPNTRAGAKVDANGCEIIQSVTIDLVNDEFDFDSAKLKPEMMRALDNVAAKIRESRGTEKLLIIGHTDSIGTEAYNQDLSERRAQAVASYLASKGVARSDMTTRGMGESQPVADNSTDAGRAKNRRVEIQTR